MGLLEWFMGTQTTPDLTTCEQRIQRGLDAYRDAGDALRTIRDARLYRNVAETFGSYCRERWQMDESMATRLIAAAEVARNLMPTGSIPKTERAARPLSKLPAGEQLEAWAEARELAAPSEPTSTEVAAAVAKRRKPTGKTRQKPTRIRVPGAIVTIEPGKGYTGTEDALIAALAKIGVIIDSEPASLAA